MQEKIIYTIGTSTRSADEFLCLIEYYKIQKIIDVRRFPKSKFIWFAQSNLISLLEERKIAYKYFGEQLGGYRKIPYREYIETSDFALALRCLEEEARSMVSCLLCCERYPWRCHRRYIAFALIDCGWDVIHIIEKDRIWHPKKFYQNLNINLTLH